MQVAAAFAVAAVATYLLTPLAIRLAVRTSFLDTPVGYKGHKRPTPYLGGTAIMLGLLTGLGVSGGLTRHHFLPIVACAIVVWVMGTIDDKFSLPIALRVAVEIAIGVALAADGLGWSVFHAAAPDTVLTVLWVLGVMNAFNLMDNMDGAAATTAAASSLGAAVLALVSGRTALAPLCFATAGACGGFLPWNLSNPAKIFMGDGGSLPLGLIVASVTMNTVSRSYLGPSGVVIGALLVGLVIFDTTLVTISRSRAGRSVLSGGRDHTTHRLRARLRTPANVALTLAIAQLVLCGVTIGVAQAGAGWVLLAGGICLLAGAVLLWQFETSSWFRVSQSGTEAAVGSESAANAVAAQASPLATRAA
jgi:UDP-GlcNAc:undecaprenyl-phosphate/decaprenyl-phosphate GlcNAc-1-phosphate transferase